MKLLIVAQDYPPLSGGIATYSASLAKEFSASDDVTVLALGARKARVYDQLRPYRTIRTPSCPLLHFPGLFPVSHYTADILRRMGLPEQHIHIISNGVDIHRFYPAKGRRSGSPPVILTVARLDLHKGHDYVLEALRLLASREMPGRPDILEGFGISFLEASASGLPIVAGHSGGVPDAVRDGKTGLLVKPDDASAIAEALQQVISDVKFARKLGYEGRRWVVSEMQWQHVMKRMRRYVAKKYPNQNCS